MSVLFINACVRERSRTMKLAQHFLDGLNDEVHEINLQNEGIKPLDGKALLLRDKLVGNGNTDHPLIRYARDFSKADMIVIAAPYWDLMFSALLKIYLEAVTVCGVTFRYDENGVPRGLCRAGQLVYITTAGGSVNRDFGFLYVKELAKSFYGIKQTKCFRAEGLDIMGADTDGIIQKALSEINEWKTRRKL